MVLGVNIRIRKRAMKELGGILYSSKGGDFFGG